MVDIKTQFDPVLRKLIKNKKQVAIIPIGSIEQHGPHLPISTDSDIVSEVAKKLADKKGYLLLPTITYGISFEHAPFFNLSIRESTLRTVLIDLCTSLLENNIKTVFIINGHHGNLKSIKNIDVKLQKILKNKLKVIALSYWHFMSRDFDHAGFVETSLMLAISKNVKMKSAKKGLITDKMTKQEIAKIGKLANQSFPKATKNGIWGDPTKATKKDGKIILTEVIENLSKKCQTYLTESRS
ncbi:MAG: creatininase family protein [Nitrosopumilus sp.]|jgi:creatinine amidohydrolase|nr:creatininase family protein [Nitrosopumilus sp.]MBT6397065.1 creatininase family protein [Nitrosopumilus sp.]MBT7919854.1 creatininase family protein [Nitrosopumilus sp.]